MNVFFALKGSKVFIIILFILIFTVFIEHIKEQGSSLPPLIPTKTPDGIFVNARHPG